ncbi:hypothetical protein LCGC14_0595980 [marine sediment metagenome]|uniref:Uncharacterized protein n=1 Tax=marine sediment metagenome TaxID=412755 RepID=A0A0F9UKD3_9ZZZZ
MRSNDEMLPEKLKNFRFSFTSFLHCPCCETGLLIIDNSPVSCPECEILRNQVDPKEDRNKSRISQEIC